MKRFSTMKKLITFASVVALIVLTANWAWSQCTVNITNVSVMNETCQGAGNGSISITATIAPTGGQTFYSINGGGSWQLVGTFNNLTPGSYSVVVSNNQGCTATATATLTAGPFQQIWFKDLDNDGYTDGITQTSCTQPSGYKPDNQVTLGDCNDNDPLQKPGQTWYKDTDNDGYSNGTTLVQCLRPSGYKAAVELTATTGDCNDNNVNIKPGATEVCNGLDDDCDIQTDEGLSNQTYVGNVTFTNQAQVNAWAACYSSIQGNLLIQNSGITSLAPLANLTQVTGNLIISQTALPNLNGLNNLESVGGNLVVKMNNFGVKLTSLNGLENLLTVGGNLQVFFNFSLTNCCTIYDLVNEVNGHSVEGSITIYQNPNGCSSPSNIPPPATFFADADGDSYGNPSVSLSTCGNAPAGYVSNDDDCNDNNSTVNPGASEVCDGLDNNCNGQTDEGFSTVFIGNVTITTQAQMNAWDPCIQTIQGNLSINSAGQGGNAVSNFGPLANVINVTGFVQISATTATSLGPINLTTVGPGGVIINANNNLTSLAGMEELTSVGGTIAVTSNSGLTSLNGLQNVVTAGALNVASNANLTDISAINLTTLSGGLGFVTIQTNAKLPSLAGLELTAIPGNFTLNNNALLANLGGGLNNLTSVGGNVSIQSNVKLVNLNGLNNLTSVTGSFTLSGNTLLTGCCAVEALVREINGYSVGGSIVVNTNATGCQSVAAINAACPLPFGPGGGGSDNLLIPNGDEQTTAVGLYPNPSLGSATVTISGKHTTGTFQLYDMAGKLTSEVKLEDGESTTLEISNLSKGLYVVHVRLDEKAFVHRLIVNWWTIFSRY